MAHCEVALHLRFCLLSFLFFGPDAFEHRLHKSCNQHYIDFHMFGSQCPFRSMALVIHHCSNKHICMKIDFRKDFEQDFDLILDKSDVLELSIISNFRSV